MAIENQWRKLLENALLGLFLFLLCLLLKLSSSYWLFSETDLHPTSSPRSATLFAYVPCLPPLSRTRSHYSCRHIRCHRSPSRLSSSTLANVCCLLLLLSSGLEINPGPGMADVVKCVYSVGTDEGDMLQWEICSCWSHCSCVKISISLAQTYPFVCPLCVKDSVLFTSTLIPHVRKLEGSLQTYIHLLQNTSGGALSIPVWDELAVI